MITMLSKHLENVKSNVSAGIINMGGATLDEPFREGEKMQINGSAMVVSADTRDEAMKIIESDIYYKSGVWDPKNVSSCVTSRSTTHPASSAIPAGYASLLD